MKLLVAVCILASLAVSKAEFNWDTILPGYVRLPPFPGFPTLRAPFNGKIAGGENASPHQFPHQVAIMFSDAENTYFCGGSLISQNYVLTAAHCADGALNFTIYLGAHNVREAEPDRIEMKLDGSAAKVHEDWIRTFIRNDIALLKLPTPAPSDNPNIGILKLTPSTPNKFVNETALVSGWGKPNDAATSISPVLRWVTQTVISNDECRHFLPILKPTNICISGQGGKSSCQGDSGGPLTVQTDIGPMQIGIVSFGSAAGCEKNLPAAFTRVSEYQKWIEANSDVRISA